MRWRILGPVEVVVDGAALNIRRPQQRGLLAVLLLNAGRVVSVEQIVAALWRDAAPPSARTQVQVNVSQIRAALRGSGLADALSSHAGGYRLVVGDAGLDLAEFTALTQSARDCADAGSLPAAADQLRAGLALWRGPALAGAAGAFVEAAAAALLEQRLAAYEHLADIELELGRHGPLVGLLRPLADEHPLRERLIGQLMLALAGSGQQAQALRLYAQTRSRLTQDLGVEPAADLVSAHLRVLRQQVVAHDETSPDEISPSATMPGPPMTGPPMTPAQLPADIAGFTGREAAMLELNALLPGDDDDRDTATAVVISAIGGAAGVGKTALAIHWAHHVAHRFVDGQLYVNLRGFDVDSRAMSPEEALGGFLGALMVAQQRVPAELSQQAALYRSLLTGRRMLVVLDNARDAEQVRPLLPGARGCLVVITSRNQLTSLVVAEGARPLTLDLLSTVDSRHLLANRVGPIRVAAEPVAVDEIVLRCARLPLALAIVGARAATYPQFPLSTLAAELHDAQGSLQAFEADDPATDVRAVFSWSYQRLDGDAARLFRLLGLHPGPDLALPAAASLAGVCLAAARSLLGRLTGAFVLIEHAPGRYTFHDLLRAYATELCQSVDNDAERDAARHRLFDHYLHAAHAADHLLDPYRLAHPLTLPVPQPDVTITQHLDHTEAIAWLTAEHRVLLAVVAQAAMTGFDVHAWQLAAALTTFLDRRGHWHNLAEAQRTALAAARRQGDLTGQAQAHRGLAIVHTWLGRHQEAHVHYQHDLDLYGEAGDSFGLANTHIGISWVLARQGRHIEALGHSARALDRYRAIGHRAGEAKALNNLGWLHARVGNHERAIACCHQALALHKKNGDRHGAALTWDSLGYAHHELGQHLRAATCYQKALEVHRQLGDRYDEAEVLANLGDSHEAAGNHDAAAKAWRHALDIFQELGHPDTDQLRAKLTAEPIRRAGEPVVTGSARDGRPAERPA